jgi:carbamoyl-phosphate synthase small subunit
MAHDELPVFSVQYHPEASPGPHDAKYLFDRFTRNMAEYGGV